MGPGIRRFVLRRVDDQLVQAALGFHEKQLTEYLFNRDIEFFKKLMQRKTLFAALEDESVVCLCYVDSNDTGSEYELGGICVDPGAEGKGVASALSRCALAAEFGWDAPPERSELIAHVHSENEKPRPLLEKLGFVKTKSAIEYDFPPEVKLKRNQRGKVEGDTFSLDFAKLEQIADWLEHFDPKTRDGVLIELDAFKEERDALIEQLRHVAQGYRSK